MSIAHGVDAHSIFFLAECCLILSEAQAPQPDHNVHDGAYNRWRPISSCSPERVSRRLGKPHLP